MEKEMTTKILTHDFPINENSLAEDLDTYMEDGYIITSITPIPELSGDVSTFRAHLLIILFKHNVAAFNTFSPIFDIGGSI